LVRSWVTYLSNTVSTGQVWLATHSLEAVEAAGINATVLLERDPTTKLVDNVGSLSKHLVLSALSRAVGTPAFSITALRFIFIEGEEAIGERERYRRVTGLSADTRFIECGSCSEVARRLAAIHGIARESGQAIRAVGVIDRDWRTKMQLEQLTKQKGLIALSVHEVENFFLHRITLEGIAKQLGQTDFDYEASLIEACDNRAGGWIIQSALSDEKASDISNLDPAARTFAYSQTWQQIEGDISRWVAAIVDRSGFEKPLQEKLQRRLKAFGKVYQRQRTVDELWKICEGKEVLKVLARKLGLSDHYTLERAATTFWDANAENLPKEVKQLREALAAE
jgi:hypothetical protein